MSGLPQLALSVRQPWAWAIVAAGKNIENRSWRRPNPGLMFRGAFAVHASTGMTRAEYEDAADFMATIGVACPPPADLVRGAIVGVARVVDVVRDSDSHWFAGPVGLVLADPQLIEPIPSPGALGFFSWKHVGDDYLQSPAKWMKNYGDAPPPSSQPDMLA